LNDPADNKNYLPIMTSAKNLFWKYGLRKVSVEEICNEAGVSRMTFYRMFKNKNEVAEQLLKQIFDDASSIFQDIMTQPIPFPEKIKKIILLKHEHAQNLSSEFMAEFYTSNESLKKIFDEYKTRITKEMRKYFTQAQKDGWIRKDLKIDFIFYMLSVIQEKIFDPEFTALHKTPHDAIMEMTNFFFYGILNSNNSEGD